MKREIKFRGRRTDNGEWVYGYYFKDMAEGRTYHVIGETPLLAHEIDPETVGQFTGLHDKDGKEIYEGDILVKHEIDYEKFKELGYRGEYPVKKENKDIATMDRFPLYWLENESFGYEGEDLEDAENWEIIDNIHDNHKLLNTK